MRSLKDVLWIIIHGEKAGGYTTTLTQKEVDHAQAVARNDRGKETEDEQDTKDEDR
jgi:hypothetical protein